MIPTGSQSTVYKMLAHLTEENVGPLFKQSNLLLLKQLAFYTIQNVEQGGPTTSADTLPQCAWEPEARVVPKMGKAASIN